MRYLAAAIVLPLAACSFHWDSDDAKAAGVKGSGTGSSRTFAVADFSGVDLRGSDDVDVRVGTGFSVRAEGDSETLDHLKIERDGSTLKIGRQNSSGFNWGSHKSAKIFVTLPRLAAANVAGSGDMTIDRVEESDFKAGIAGSGNLTVATVQIESADLSIAGSGNLKLAGTTKRLEMSIAGSGDIEAKDLKAGAAKVSIVGSGGATATVNGNAEVNIMGSGDVDLGGGARCQTNKMGSGSVRCGN